MGIAFRAGKTTPVAVTKEVFARIAREDPALNCFITKLPESASNEARESEKRFASGSPAGALDGIPIAVKDIFYISGVRCTAGSRILADNVAPYDSTVIRRLKAAGAVIVGTTNLHEFAAGVTSDNPHFGAVRNPWDVSRVAGGSSGGSAAAVASGMVPLALGTDTAGSVRIPAALCGVLGLKPTYGRVSRLGVVPLAASLDTVGVLGRSAWDLAAFLQVIAGHEEGDLTTVATPVPDYVAEIGDPVGRPRVGVPRSAFEGLVAGEVLDPFETFLENLGELGCRVSAVELEGWDDASSLFVPIRRAEATAFHLRWLQATPELYGEDVRQLLEKGMDVRAVDYVNAVNSRPSLMERFIASLGDSDFLAVPATRVPAPHVGENSVEVAGRRVEVYSALNALTLPFNIVGFPVISVPMGQTAGLPVGAQLVARPFDESKLLRLTHAYENRFGPFASPPGADGETR